MAYRTAPHRAIPTDRVQAVGKGPPIRAIGFIYIRISKFTLPMTPSRLNRFNILDKPLHPWKTPSRISSPTPRPLRPLSPVPGFIHSFVRSFVRFAPRRRTYLKYSPRWVGGRGRSTSPWQTLTKNAEHRQKRVFPSLFHFLFFSRSGPLRLLNTCVTCANDLTSLCNPSAPPGFIHSTFAHTNSVSTTPIRPDAINICSQICAAIVFHCAITAITSHACRFHRPSFPFRSP